MFGYTKPSSQLIKKGARVQVDYIGDTKVFGAVAGYNFKNNRFQGYHVSLDAGSMGPTQYQRQTLPFSKEDVRIVSLNEEFYAFSSPQQASQRAVGSAVPPSEVPANANGNSICGI